MTEPTLIRPALPVDALGLCKDDRTRTWLELVRLESGAVSVREWIDGRWVDQTASVIERHRARLVALNAILKEH